MRRLFFGGSFNPIHHGHLLCAQAAAQAAGFDRITLIPSGRPPHKANRGFVMASAEDRLVMCRLAIGGVDLFEVNDIELRRSGPSYTIATVRQLKTLGAKAVHWLVGADTLPQLPTWHEAANLVREVEFVVMARPGWQLAIESLPPELEAIRVKAVATPLIEISATDIRRRVKASQPVDYLTPRPVVEYIRARQLYQ